jgi:hypothetical protein
MSPPLNNDISRQHAACIFLQVHLSDLSPLRVKVLYGSGDREFTSVYVTDLPDPGRYLSGGELVLTGLMWWHGPDDSARFVDHLVRSGVAALGAGQGWLGHVPADLVTACAAADLPLIEIPADVSFRAVLDLTARRLAGDVREALGRHRRLVAAVAEGADLPELFAALGVTGAVISSTGTVIGRSTGRGGAGPGLSGAGSARASVGDGVVPATVSEGSAPTAASSGSPPRTVGGSQVPGTVGGDSASASVGGDLASGSVGGDSAPASVGGDSTPASVGGDSTPGSVGGGSVPASVGGNLAPVSVAGDLAPASACGPTAPASVGGDLTPGSVGGPAADNPVRLARAYLTAPRLPHLVSGRTIFGVGRMPRPAGWALVVDGDFIDRADIGYELASCVALVRRRLDEGRRVERRLLTELLDSPSDTRLETCGLAGAYCVVSATCSAEVLEELLDRQVVAVPSGPSSIALVPLPEPASWDSLASRLRSACSVLSDPSLSVGLSSRLTGSSALRGGLEEAGHARSLAESRSGGVVTSDEIYTHALLLATMPEDVRRSFTERLLGPLLAYDAAHQSELVRTLEAFLDCAGSWQVCGERMHVHVNTVRYRIRRVEELTGRDLSSMADRVDFYLALRAR